MIGKRLSPILVEIEETLWEANGIKPDFTPEATRAACKIFITVLMDKMFDLQEQEEMPIEDRENMAIKLGTEIRNLVKTYANIDTFKMYEEI